MADQPQSDSRNGGPEKDDLHEMALRHANEAWAAEIDNITQGREDQKFYAGEQWPENSRQSRDKENRPVIVINRLPQFIKQVTGDIRKDTPSINVLPARDGTQKKADIFKGLIRNIEQQSNARAAYVQAVDNACQVGMGVFRIMTEYSSDDAFEQDIRIKRVMDPFAALCDPSAKEPDKSDARYWFVIDDMDIEEFKRQYPDAAVDGFPGDPGQLSMVWKTENTIRVAEYWYKEPTTKTLLLMSDGSVRDEDDKNPLPPGVTELKRREVKTQKVMQVIMSGRENLTEPVEWAGKYIPIVPVVGEEIRFSGRTMRRGMVRDAKGPQQVYNYMTTASVEYVGKQPSVPFVGTVKQFEGFEDDWAQAGTGNKAFLPYNSDSSAPGAPQRAQPPQNATGMVEQAIKAANDIEAVIGIYKESLGAQSNANSGRAILARQKEGDTGTFYYVDNLRTGLAYAGKILIDLIPKIYDTPRIVRTLKEDGSAEMVKINQPPPAGFDPNQPPAGVDLQAMYDDLNDLTIGEYDVVVSTGPGYATKRMETQDAVVDLMRNVPQIASAGIDILVKNLDFPGSDELAARLKQQQNQGPNPAQLAEVADTMAAAQLKKAQAEKAEVEATSGTLAIMQTMQAMQQSMQTMQQMLASGLPQIGPGGPPPAPPPMQQPAGPPAGAAPAESGEGELVDIPPQ